METQLAHLHLIVNHLPIFGSILGTLVLAYGLTVKSRHTKIAGYLLLAISAFGAAIAFATGDPAQEIVENIAGISTESIKLHEEAAQISLAIMFILGLSSLAGIYSTYFKTKFKKQITLITLLIGIISFISVSITGYLGGKIRHTEFNTTNQFQLFDEKSDHDSNEKEEYEYEKD